MAIARINRSAATLSKNRTPDSVSPFSGMCATCIEGCIGMCEIGKSAVRGPECLYPQPFGIMTAASEKSYPCLLYTSDAADDLLCVDLGGRRIIKKKNNTNHA